MPKFPWESGKFTLFVVPNVNHRMGDPNKAIGHINYAQEVAKGEFVEHNL